MFIYFFQRKIKIQLNHGTIRVFNRNYRLIPFVLMVGCQLLLFFAIVGACYRYHLETEDRIRKMSPWCKGLPGEYKKMEHQPESLLKQEENKAKTLKECIKVDSKYLNDRVVGLLSTEYEIEFLSNENVVWVFYPKNDDRYPFVRHIISCIYSDGKIKLHKPFVEEVEIYVKDKIEFLSWSLNENGKFLKFLNKPKNIVSDANPVNFLDIRVGYSMFTKDDHYTKYGKKI